MRYGFTTGSCAAAAAKAAAYMLLSGNKKTHIEIETPSGKMFKTEVVDIALDEGRATCSVIKDGGDDPDVTTGAHICVQVEYGDQSINEIIVDGGVGVGRVTKPGLDQPVGNAAINSIPRQMIIKEVNEVKEFLDYKGTLVITVSVPEGEELAAKTFNPRLGINGGISILGTTGIVEPMSNQAIIDTIRVELKQRKALGYEYVCISPGNYGLDFLRSNYDFDLDKAVKCSNFIGTTLDLATELGYEEILLAGHLGKLVKVAGGIMNTHSKEADCRMEILASAVIRSMNKLQMNMNGLLPMRILDCVNTEEAYSLIKNESEELVQGVSEVLMSSIHDSLNRRTRGETMVQCMVYTNEHGLIGMTQGAFNLLEKIRNSYLNDMREE